MNTAIDLSGKHLRLRTTVASDEAALVAIRSTDEVRRRWRGDDLEAEFASQLVDDDGHQLTMVAGDDHIVGLIQFSEEKDPEYRSASIDIYVDPAAHRRGYASDALRTLIAYLFTERGHHRLTIDPAADNAPAIACYAGVGFSAVGVMHRYELQGDGTWADGLLMEILTD